MGNIDTRHSQRHSTHQFLDALELLLNRDWFGRVWVAQELALASRDPIVFCGASSVSWSRFAATFETVRTCVLDEPGSSGGEVGFRGLKPVSSIAAMISVKKQRDDDVLLAVASKSIRVSNLARIRETGKRASLAEQIYRTLYMQASNPRDRIFAVLAFTEASEQKIVADYTKSKEQVSAELAALIKEDLVGYMMIRLWEHMRYNAGLTPGYQETRESWANDQVPSFSAELDVLGRRSLHKVCYPYLPDLRPLVDNSTGVLPIADFTHDCREMRTLGYDMDHVTAMNAHDGSFSTSKAYHGIAPFNDLPPFDIFLVGLFGINAPFLLRRIQDEPANYKIVAFVNV